MFINNDFQIETTLKNIQNLENNYNNKIELLKNDQAN